jgi:hypothetical protein
MRRLIRSAEEEGLTNYQIKVGDLTFVRRPDAVTTTETDTNTNIWDEVLNAAHKERSS